MNPNAQSTIMMLAIKTDVLGRGARGSVSPLGRCFGGAAASAGRVGRDRPTLEPADRTLTSDSLSPAAGPQVIGPSRASASGAPWAEVQEPAERLRKIVAGLQVYRSAP
jgi:hypothetical protein